MSIDVFSDSQIRYIKQESTLFALDGKVLEKNTRFLTNCVALKNMAKLLTAIFVW